MLALSYSSERPCYPPKPPNANLALFSRMLSSGSLRHAKPAACIRCFMSKPPQLQSYDCAKRSTAKIHTDTRTYTHTRNDCPQPQLQQAARKCSSSRVQLAVVRAALRVRAGGNTGSTNARSRVRMHYLGSEFSSGYYRNVVFT